MQPARLTAHALRGWCRAAMQAHALDPSWLDGAVTLGRAARNAAYLKVVSANPEG